MLCLCLARLDQELHLFIIFAFWLLLIFVDTVCCLCQRSDALAPCVIHLESNAMLKKFLFATLLASSLLMPCVLKAQTTVSFQNGVDGYAGLVDIIIGRNNVLEDVDLEFGESNVLGSSVENYFLDGRYGDFAESADEKQALMRFDGILQAIPVDATIISATLEITTSPESFSEFSDSGGPYAVSQLLVPFDETTTYNSEFDGLRFGDAETERPEPNGFVALVPDELEIADMTAIVQAWVDGDPNFGVTVTAGTTNGWAIATSGNVNPLLTPRLVVTYVEDAEPTAFESGTLVQTSGDSSTEMFLASPLPEVDEDQIVDGDGVRFDGEFLDFNGGETEALIQFNEIFESDGGSGFVPDNATIEKATLVVTTANFERSANVGTAGEFGVRQILTDWSDSSVFADLSFGEFVDGEFGMISDTEASFDVTSIVEAWQSGEANNGFNVASTGSTDGWAILFQSAGGAAPRLIIEYSESTFLLGDANQDGAIDFGDLGAFIQALNDKEAYDATYPIPADTILDMDGSGTFNFGDIAGFLGLF